MAIYAIGDIQGCFDEFEKLLDHIQFQPNKDTLWFTGDLVNRGLQSLQVMRYIKALGDKHQVILGNHDLHLIAVAYGAADYHRNDTFKDILEASDKVALIEWLRHRPLFHADDYLGYVIAHAGLAPSWQVEQARALAKEVESILQSNHPSSFLKNMYGDQPDRWRDDLEGMERLRCITNYFTRMRMCTPEGKLDLSFKGALADKPSHLIPWFDVPHRVNRNNKIIFGHWAALGGKADVPNVYPLDTGCVWGNSLTAMRLGDEQHFSIPCTPR